MAGIRSAVADARERPGQRSSDARRYFRMAAAAVVCFEGVDGETPPGFRVASDGLSATNGEHGECNVFLRVPEMACPLRLTLDMPDTGTAEHFPFEHAIVMGADSFNHQGEQAAFSPSSWRDCAQVAVAS